ncbi:hypothetical protein [Aureibaculum conchae]|uniref:hypothetical protein n=1 Tax=Aureibaculum sp. 2308TA14-22 TaxID=3108392 RepID=UPI00339AE3FB
MKIVIQISIYLAILSASAQDKFADKVIAPLQKNQLFFEKVFIDTNKTSYFTNDYIWFKAYVGGLDNKPSFKTTRLYVNLLDSNGKVVQNKDVLIYRGTGKGQFKLNDTLNSGKYYIQAYTNYMRNFGDDNMFVKEINILSDIPDREIETKNNYDIQILPEGGYLLEDVENVIGIKSLINGKGFEYSGTIINSKNEEVVNFKSEHLGMTKCSFFYKPKEKYKALININDTLIKVDVPLPKREGLHLNVTKKEEDFVNFSLKTNHNSIKELHKRNYNLLFHQRNRIIDNLQISRIDSTNVNIKINKKFFLNGVNTVTLFENSEPIIERKFYIEREDNNVSFSLKESGVEKDSIKYSLKISDTNSSKPIESNISISVLPINSLSHNQTTNIKSAFLLTPYVKGYVENPAYYFNKNNTERATHLDLLLLTQGWTTYSLDEMIENFIPSYKYDFELGFELNGTVSPLLSDELALITKDDLLIDKISLNKKNDFSFKKLLVYKGDSVKVSFIDTINNIIKPKKLKFDTIKLNTPVDFIPKHFSTKQEKEVQNNSSWKELFYSNSTQLDEVTVVGKRRSDRYYKRQKLIKKYKSVVFGIGQYYDLELPNHYTKYNSDLMSYLRMNEGVSLVNWRGVENYLQVSGTKEASLSIDGERISSEELPGVLIEMDDVESIFVSSRRGYRSYQVFTTDNYKKNIVLLYDEYVFKEGYDKEKRYYTPRYDYETTDKTLNWIEVDWKTNLIPNAFGEIGFKILQNKKLEGYLFSIQGFSNQGHLISEIIRK